MAIQGLVDNNDWTTDERPKNWRAAIARLKIGGSVPLTALTSRMRKRSVDDPEFNWWEKETQSRRIQLTGTLTAGTGSLTTTTTVGGGFLGVKQGDLLLLEQTGEIVLVSGDPSADTSCPVIRGYAGTTATALTPTASGVNPNAIVIGSAYEESSVSPTGIHFRPTKVTNYTQIFRQTYEFANTAAETRLRTGDQVAEARRECLEVLGMDMERAFFLGQKSETTRNGRPVRTTDGVETRIATANVFTADTSTGADMEDLEGWMEAAFRYGSSEKVAFGGNEALLTVNQIVRKNASMQIFSGIKEFGMNVTRIESPFGNLVIFRHPLFNYMTGGTTGTSTAKNYYGRNSWLYILDMSNIGYVYMRNRDLKFESGLEANDQDGMKSGYISECALEVRHPKTHALVKNLAIGKAD